MNNKMTFHINNQAYIVNLDIDTNGKFQNELEKLINIDKNIDTKELLTAYIQQTHRLLIYEEQLKDIVDSIIEE
jgi:hypothetical protein